MRLESVVTDWLSRFKHVKGYRRNFLKWCKWIGISPSEQLVLRKGQLKNDDLKIQRFFEEKLKEWGAKIMEEGISRKTGEQYLISVRSFFSHYYMPLVFRRGELRLEELPEIKATHRPKFIIDNVELRAIFSMCNPRDRPLLLILASTGLSPVDVANLRIEGLRLYESEGKISKTPVYGIKAREKSNIDQHFVLGEETLFYLEPILRERNYPVEGYLLATQKENPYDQRSINRRIKSLAEKALGEKASEFETKNLRDSFRNSLLLAEVNPEVHDAMMGWQRPGASQHYRISEAVILQAYDKAKAHWSVDHGRQQDEKIANIEALVGKMALKSAEENERLREEIGRMWEALNILLEHPELAKDYPPDLRERLSKMKR